MKKIIFNVGILILVAVAGVIGCKSEMIEVPPPSPPDLTPAITSVVPSQGRFGDLIIIKGLNFGSTMAENKVTFNDLEAVITDASATQLQVEVPKGAGSGPIKVRTDEGSATSLEFTYELRAVVETVAGNGMPGMVNGTSGQVQFNNPRGLFMKSDGTLLIADAGNSAIRKFLNGTTSTLAVAEDHIVNDVHVQELADGRSFIWMVTVPDFDGFIFKGSVYRSVNGEVQDFNDFRLRYFSFIPGGISTSKGGNTEYVTDFGNHVVYGSSISIAGTMGKPGNSDSNGDDALLRSPSYIRTVLNSRGNDQLYFVDQGNHSIRTTEVLKLAPKNPTFTLAGAGQPGFADGLGEQAQFNRPRGLDVDALGNVFVADFQNNAIRKITPDGEVTTILKSAGEVSAKAEPQLIDGPDGEARFNGPFGVAVASDGSLFVSDLNHHAIRRITFE